MPNTYIKILITPSTVQKSPENISSRLVKEILTEGTPDNNPDFAAKIKDATSWLIEFEGDSYYPEREIGLDSTDDPIIIMPWRKNYGYWTDSNITLKDLRAVFEITAVTKIEFEKHWNAFVSKKI